ncbi:pectinesterase family protein [Actinoplanes teichomyceticus]|uniref:Pectinesterase n=1 Tax=Actinoplanes teichomyceticus TaxID=1867 RepID=A0A561WB03_ACTTI|nr:pectinesterase family protein [Actinoplanes teichomyceticus]TWG21044.1 pectinesterase [Actinoplanes teichomyceticus]GIF14864.1 pectinesterase [Actinoplanes teichomyceticus]
MRRRTFLELTATLGAGVTWPSAAAAAAAVPGTGAADGPGARPGRRRPDLIVAADGSGDLTTVQAAIDAAPSGATTPYVIGIRPGAYLGQVVVPAAKTFLELRGLGSGPADVVIADDRANGTLKPDGTPWGTSGSASVTLSGADFRAADLTFANLFDEAAHPEITNRQAVAVLTRADRLAFERVRFLGNQDTLYVNSTAAGVIARAYFRDCHVEGDVDFIFGRATAVFERCRIHSLDRGSTPNGYVTAPSTDLANPHGLLFARCRLTSDAAAGTVLLGRPWHPGNDPNAVGQTVVRESWIGPHVGETAWSDFGTWPWTQARLREYRNVGPGALVTAGRPQLTRAEAAVNEIPDFLRGADGWSPDLPRHRA